MVQPEQESVAVAALSDRPYSLWAVSPGDVAKRVIAREIEILQAIVTADKAWSRYAAARSLNHSPGAFGWGPLTWSRVAGEFGGVPIVCELSDSGRSTRISAALTLPLPGRVEVKARGAGFLATLAFAVDRRRIVLEPRFDRTFAIRSASESTARAVLRPSVRNTMLNVRASELLYQVGETAETNPCVVMKVERIVVDDGELDATLRAVVEVSRLPIERSPYR